MIGSLLQNKYYTRCDQKVPGLYKPERERTSILRATLPPNIKSALNHGPKFSQEPRLCPVTKLSLVRWMGGLAVPEHQERCVADGVDVLQRTAGQSTRSFKTSNIVTYFSEHNLKLVTADKEGGFVVAPSALYGVKASQAIARISSESLQDPCQR
ncbi:hypothetical protein HPB47_004667 [Ixodes persulcatus]|uniref:Uncharacterized protein n=1 Tax=Ixodes persulcatus TaxID=34615 RepID=A0AC60PFX7_IXOPE|nr:hypothetical protein HPB47_004667 [Ixodes persulcatus]